MGNDAFKENDGQQRARGVKQRRKPLSYERQAELEQHFNRILPEPEPPPFEAKPIDDLKISWQQGDTRAFIEQKKMEMVTYKRKKNPSIILLFNLSSAKMYYDIEKDSYYLYIFPQNRKRIMRKIKLEKHDIQQLLAFALFDRYGEEIPKTLWINRKIREKALEIAKREKEHYTRATRRLDVGVENGPS